MGRFGRAPSIAVAVAVAAVALFCVGCTSSADSVASSSAPGTGAARAVASRAPTASAAASGSANGTLATGSPAPVTVQVSVSHCGSGWSGGGAGPQSFALRNSDTRPAEVMLTDAHTGAVFAEVETLGPGTSAPMSVVLPPGSYAFHCALEDADVIEGPAVTLTGSKSATVSYSPSVLPVTQQDLIGPTQAYEAYVSQRLPALRTLTATLAGDVRRGDLPAARRDWLPAHLLYEQLGAAYGAFGDADAVINGLPDGLPKGSADQAFTGFHRLEQGLWRGETAAKLAPAAAGLLTAVTQLGATFPDAQIDPLEVAIRAHEITENALQFELTGRTDFGSHSNLATVEANLTGTQVVLGLFQPLLAPRYPALPQLQQALRVAEKDVRAHHTAAGWAPLDSLTTTGRERINADISSLTELLAPVASICEPRRTQ